jgi:hypothetical protein
VTYNVQTSVSVQVSDSQDAAMKSGAQNVIGITTGGATTNDVVNKNFGGPDTGTWILSDVQHGNIAAHEFTHLLGVDDKDGRNLSNSNSIDGGWFSNPHATTQDFRWALGGELRFGHAPMMAGQQIQPAQNPFRFTVGAPFKNEAWWK